MRRNKKKQAIKVLKKELKIIIIITVRPLITD